VAKLGIIAGAGKLPAQVINACTEAGREFAILAFEGSADPAEFDNLPVTWIKMSKLSAALKQARDAGVEELVMAGKIPRPSVLELMRDPRSAKFMAKVGTRILGDDNILSAVVKELEVAEGFRVIAPDQIIDGLLAVPGAYGTLKPDDTARADIKRGLAVVRELGKLDIGQAAIVQNGLIIGVEGAEGTDALIGRCAEFVDPEQQGGVLVKAAKPGQEERVDLPAIGVSTLKASHKCGLRGIAVEAGRALVLERTELIKEADGAGLFVYGISNAD